MNELELLASKVCETGSIIREGLNGGIAVGNKSLLTVSRYSSLFEIRVFGKNEGSKYIDKLDWSSVKDILTQLFNLSCVEDILADEEISNLAKSYRVK